MTTRLVTARPRAADELSRDVAASWPTAQARHARGRRPHDADESPPSAEAVRAPHVPTAHRLRCAPEGRPRVALAVPHARTESRCARRAPYRLSPPHGPRTRWVPRVPRGTTARPVVAPPGTAHHQHPPSPARDLIPCRHNPDPRLTAGHAPSSSATAPGTRALSGQPEGARWHRSGVRVWWVPVAVVSDGQATHPGPASTGPGDTTRADTDRRPRHARATCRHVRRLLARDHDGASRAHRRTQPPAMAEPTSRVTFLPRPQASAQFAQSL